jgi:hypothetical protein
MARDDPHDLATDLGRAAWAAARALAADVRIDPKRITNQLFSAAIGLEKAIGEVASAAEADGRVVEGKMLRDAQARQGEAILNLAWAVKEFERG